MMVLKALIIILSLGRVTNLLASEQVKQSIDGTNQRPNILLILTDDQGWPTLGCYRNDRVPTPHLDRLASQGIRFTDGYVTPQCTPTRASLLTGQHTARNGMWHVIPWYGYPWARVQESTYTEQLSRNTLTIADALKESGYTTACIGKWHLTTNEDGSYLGLKPEASSHYGFDDAAPEVPRSLFSVGQDRGVDYLTDRAIQFIEANQDRPFFCYLAHHTIHGVVVAPKPIVQKYLDQGYPETGMFNATYLAAIEHLDHSIGRLMTKLNDLDLSRRTVVVFVSDNGGVSDRYDIEPIETDSEGFLRLPLKDQQFDNSPLRAGKGSPYEGGIRVPLIIRWPWTIEPGITQKTPVHVVDFFPTFLEIAGASDPPDHLLDGESLMPILRQEDSFPTRSLYWYFPLYDLRWGLTPCAVIRQGRYKLIDYFGDRFDREGRYRPGPQLQLFDLVEDIGEQRNLADELPAIVRSLQDELQEWLATMPVTRPTENPFFDPNRIFEETREKPFRLQSLTFPDPTQL